MPNITPVTTTTTTATTTTQEHQFDRYRVPPELIKYMFAWLSRTEVDKFSKLDRKWTALATEYYANFRKDNIDLINGLNANQTHPNVMEIPAHMMDTCELLFSGGSLKNYLLANTVTSNSAANSATTATTTTFSPEPIQAAKILYEVLQGIRHLQSKGVVHGNIRAENVMLEQEVDEQGRPLYFTNKEGEILRDPNGEPVAVFKAILVDAGKQLDFALRQSWGDDEEDGLSAKFEEVHADPLRPMPPEWILEKKLFPDASDMWLFGLLISEMFHSHEPFAALKDELRVKLSTDDKAALDKGILELMAYEGYIYTVSDIIPEEIRLMCQNLASRDMRHRSRSNECEPILYNYLEKLESSHGDYKPLPDSNS